MTGAPVWTDRCEVNDCGRPCKNKLMCLRHWRKVPAEVRDALRDAHLNFRADRSDAAYNACMSAARRCIHAAEVAE